jgi:hypothetical protein
LNCIAITGTGAGSWDFYYNATFATSGKRLYVSNTLTLAGTDGTTMTFPTTSATVARTDAAQTFTGQNTFLTTPLVNTFSVGKLYNTTSNLAAGANTNVTLTGVTTEPFSVQIFDSDGVDITEAVKDSTAVSAGVYHTWIYSVDAKTNAKIKVLW